MSHVVILPKSRIFVYSPFEEGIADLVTFRAILKTAALRLLPTAALSGRLQVACGKMERALVKGDMRSYGQADTEFHLEIV